MEAFDGRFLDCAIHPLDMTIGPRVVRLGEPLLDVVCLADHGEAHLERPGGVSVTVVFELNEDTLPPTKQSFAAWTCLTETGHPFIVTLRVCSIAGFGRKLRGMGASAG